MKKPHQHLDEVEITMWVLIVVLFALFFAAGYLFLKKIAP
jgi:hypothetical protein